MKRASESKQRLISEQTLLAPTGEGGIIIYDNVEIHLHPKAISYLPLTTKTAFVILLLRRTSPWGEELRSSLRDRSLAGTVWSKFLKASVLHFAIWNSYGGLSLRSWTNLLLGSAGSQTTKTFLPRQSKSSLLNFNKLVRWAQLLWVVGVSEPTPVMFHHFGMCTHLSNVWHHESPLVLRGSLDQGCQHIWVVGVKGRRYTSDALESQIPELTLFWKIGFSKVGSMDFFFFFFQSAVMIGTAIGEFTWVTALQRASSTSLTTLPVVQHAKHLHHTSWNSHIPDHQRSEREIDRVCVGGAVPPSCDW